MFRDSYRGATAAGNDERVRGSRNDTNRGAGDTSPAPRPVKSRSPHVYVRRPPSLLDSHLRAGLFELLLEVLGLGLVHAFLDDLGRALDEVLRLGETEVRHLAN